MPPRKKKKPRPAPGPVAASGKKRKKHFHANALRAFFTRNVEQIAAQPRPLRASQPELAARLEEARARLAELLPLIDAPGALDLEDLERRLTVIEEKLTAALTASAPEEFLVDVRREMDRQLAPYRRKMTAAQLAQLERQYMQKRLWERYNLPRLSLFYLT